MKHLSLYEISPSYCKYLKQSDCNVPDLSQIQTDYPLTGIVIPLNGYRYFAPLAPLKERHKNQRKHLDFIAIEEGKLGGINLNNMIPVPDFCLKKSDLKISAAEPKEMQNYKHLKRRQIEWINSHKDLIESKATALYKAITNHSAPEKLKGRCCQFDLDEKLCESYCGQNSQKDS